VFPERGNTRTITGWRALVASGIEVWMIDLLDAY
jgi:hypothetical protein